MARGVMVVFGCGIAGLLLVPVIVFFLVIASAPVLDPRCGGPGDSGGCAMGAATLGVYSAVPGLAAGAALGLLLALRRRKPQPGESGP